MTAAYATEPVIEPATEQAMTAAAAPVDETWLREVFDKEIALIEDDFGIALRERWGWR